MEIILRAAAKKRGLTQYFTGRPCKYGHTSPRFVCDARCLDCARQFSARYRANNLEDVREVQKLARREKRDACNAYLAEYRRKNPEAVKLATRRWASNNKPRKRAIAAKHYATKRHRFPPWADSTKLREFYQACPTGYEVRHIHPLHGRSYSGLHVVENLQYRPAPPHRLARRRQEPQP